MVDSAKEKQLWFNVEWVWVLLKKKHVFFLSFLWVIDRSSLCYSYLWFFLMKKTNKYIVEVGMNYFIYYWRKKKRMRIANNRNHILLHKRFNKNTYYKWQRQNVQREHMHVYVCNICTTVIERRKNGIKRATRRAYMKKKRKKRTI
jgi:hypothetical protein